MAPKSTLTCASPSFLSTTTPTNPPKEAPKKPKPHSIAPPNEEPFSSKNKGPLKKAKAKPVARKPAATKKSPAAPKKAAAGKLTAPSMSPAKAAAERRLEAKREERASASAKITAGGDGGQIDAGNDVSKTPPVKRGRPAKRVEKTPWSGIVGQYVTGPSKAVSKPSGGVVAKFQKMLRKSVLVRPTALAVYDRKKMDEEKVAAKSKSDIIAALVEEEKDGVVKVSRIMDLPKEVRTRIWRHAVVRRGGFIWPENDLGYEQPDLAMACRAIRGEVLPIFYAENAFAICLHPTAAASKSKAKAKSKAPGKQHLLAEKWGEALDGTTTKPGWFSYIRRWVFFYDAPKPKDNALSLLPENSFVVSVNFSKRGSAGGFWDASVEVHRDALCLLPAHEEFGACGVKTVPEWLNDPVIDVTEIAKGGNIKAAMVFELKEKIERDVGWIQEVRCEELSLGSPECDVAERSIET